MPKGERTLGINMRELNPQGKLSLLHSGSSCLLKCFALPDIDKLVTVKGLVIRCTPIIPDMKIGKFLQDSLLFRKV